MAWNEKDDRNPDPVILLVCEYVAPKAPLARTKRGSAEIKASICQLGLGSSSNGTKKIEVGFIEKEGPNWTAMP